MSFNQLDGQQLDRHVKAVAWLNIASEAFSLAMGGLVFLFFTGIGFVTGEAEAAGILAIVGTFACAIFWLFSLPGLIGGLGLLRRAKWARVLLLIVSLFNLIWFPIGTMISLYTFWVLLQDGAAPYFERPSAEAYEDEYDEPYDGDVVYEDEYVYEDDDEYVYEDDDRDPVTS